ncbi:hypothetical protein D3C87_2129130 [compost metagenome]
MFPEASRYPVVEYICPGIVQLVRPPAQLVGTRSTLKAMPNGLASLKPIGSSFRLIRS